MKHHSMIQWLPLMVLAAMLPGCYQRMAIQPKLKPQSPTQFFADGRSTRPQVVGTVARGTLQEDAVFSTGKVSDLGVVTAGAPADPKSILAQYTSEFPLEVNESLLLRGKERYNIYCNVCHGQTGAADGTIVMRGFLHPPAFWEQSPGNTSHNSRGLRYQGAGQLSLESAPVGYIFHVITHGYGAMGSYSAQISPRDRWAIVAYIRALQKARATEASIPSTQDNSHPKGAH